MNRTAFLLFSVVLAATPLQSPRSAENGSKAPACTLTAIDTGHTYDLQQFAGKVVYVDFWASWCPPCAKSFPFLNALNRDLKHQGLQVIGVNLDEIPEDAKAFVLKHRADFPVAFDPDAQCAKSLNVKAMPSSYLIDGNGIIRNIHLGFRTGEAQQLRILIEQLLAEKTVDDPDYAVILKDE